MRASTSLQLSSAALFRTPQHSDPVPITAIVSHAEVFSPTSLPDPSNPVITASQQRPIPTFLCRTVYDVKPIPGAGFWGDLDWDEHRQAAVRWYHRRVENKELGRAVDGWDVEAVMEESEEEDSEVERERTKKSEAAKERARRREKERQQARAGSGARRKAAIEEDVEFSESGSVSRGLFPRSRRQILIHSLGMNPGLRRWRFL